MILIYPHRCISFRYDPRVHGSLLLIYHRSPKGGHFHPPVKYFTDRNHIKLIKTNKIKKKLS